MDVRLHTYHPTRSLLLLEYIPTSTSTPRSKLSQPPNVLLFIGGMYDNFRSPLYVDDIAALFPSDVADPTDATESVGQRWSVFHVQLSSAGRAFGIGGLDRDVSVFLGSLHAAHTSWSRCVVPLPPTQLVKLTLVPPYRSLRLAKPSRTSGLTSPTLHPLLLSSWVIVPAAKTQCTTSVPLYLHLQNPPPPHLALQSLV